MGLSFRPLHPTIGVEVLGVDLSKDIEGNVFVAIRQQLDTAGVLLIRDQQLDDAAFVAFGRSFGDLEKLPEPDKRDGAFPEIFNLSNVRSDGGLVDFDETQSVFLRGTERWHTDSSYREIPCLATMLYSVEVPNEGGNTQFADMRAAYAALPDDVKQTVEDMRAVHSYEYSRSTNPGYMPPMDDEERAKVPPVVHPVARRQHDGRRSLYLGTHASHIDGMPVDQGRGVLAQLLDRATQPEFIYEHKWRPKDLVVWDNRCTLHRICPYDITKDRRIMRRITVTGCEPVV